MVFLGIDPGQSGGIAVLNSGPAQAWPMPETDLEIYNLLREFSPSEIDREKGVYPLACLEKVNAMSPGRQACFQLGGSYRALRMALTACGIPFHEERPEAWQRAVGCPPAKRGTRTYAQRKAVLRARAQALFPGVAVTNKTADALLLAWHAQQICRVQK